MAGTPPAPKERPAVELEGGPRAGPRDLSGLRMDRQDGTDAVREKRAAIGRPPVDRPH